MDYNFTDSCRVVLAKAREEALRLGHDYVGTEHILLGLVAAEGLLDKFGLEPSAVIDAVERVVRRGKVSISLGELPYHSRGKKVLELAMATAREHKHGYIGPEHLLIGLAREEKGIAAQVLASLGLDLDEANRVLDQMGHAGRGDTARGGSYNFTDRLRKVLAMARQEAVRLQHEYVGTEHLLLGLTREGEGVATAVLTNLGVDLGQIQERVEESVRRGAAAVALGELPYTSRAKKVLEFAMAESRELNHSYVGTEHLLAGLLREDKGIAAQVLNSLGVSLEDARAQTLKVLGSDHPPSETAGFGRGSAPGGRARRTPGDREVEELGRLGFTIELDDTSASSIYEQIIERVREAVATGKLQSGQKLRPVRRLADELDIAPGTVARAYAELERLGVVVTDGARGTRVAETRRNKPASDERLDTLAGLLRPVAVAAFHMGGTAEELRKALESAMKGILGRGTDTTSGGGRP